jgi:hypothetical protein
MQITFPWNPTPAPSPPTPTPAGSVNLTITMSDSWGDGWNGNIFGFKQNGAIVATFGTGFSSGRSFGPVTVTIPGNVLTQIIVVQYGYYTNEVGFIVKSSNNSTIYTRLPSFFISTIIFAEFCPSTSCGQSTTITYYLTVTDSYGDGWNGNILAFRQNGVSQTFQLSSGYSSGPTAFTFTKGVNVDIIVNKLGTWTYECGYILRAASGAIVVRRNAGNYFYANTILNSFNPGSINLAPVRILDFDPSGRSKD